MSASSLITRNVVVDGRRTSVRLEPELWQALDRISRSRGVSVNDICSHVSQTRGAAGGFTSALRVYIIDELQRLIREAQTRR